MLLLARLLLGAVTATAVPAVASLTGDFFPAGERGRIYGYISVGEVAGAGSAGGEAVAATAGVAGRIDTATAGAGADVEAGSAARASGPATAQQAAMKTRMHWRIMAPGPFKTSPRPATAPDRH
jgi:MFS family permease